MELRRTATIAFSLLLVFTREPVSATTKGLSQIVTPDVQPEGDLSISFQAQDRKIANPFEMQAELRLTPWAEVAVFKGLDPQEFRFATEIAVKQKLPYLLPVGVLQWTPQPRVDPQLSIAPLCQI